MKGFLCFLAGFVVGVVCVLLLGVGATVADDGRTFFVEPEECIVERGSLEVFQYIGNGAALVKRKNASYNDDLIMLLQADENVEFYDEQVIKIPAGKCARQVGVYKYKNRMDMLKTVPIVKIME